MSFKLHPSLQTSCFELIQWPLSTLYLKNNAKFPWVILIPRIASIHEIHQLNPEQQMILMQEIAEISNVMERIFHPDKLNIGSLGNIVSQLHIHVIARFRHDSAWPYGVWQPHSQEEPYSNTEKNHLIQAIKNEIENMNP